MKQELKYLTLQEILELTELEKQMISKIGYEEFLRRKQYPRNKKLTFNTDKEMAEKIKSKAMEEGISISTWLHNFFSNDTN